DRAVVRGAARPPDRPRDRTPRPPQPPRRQATLRCVCELPSMSLTDASQTGQLAGAREAFAQDCDRKRSAGVELLVGDRNAVPCVAFQLETPTSCLHVARSRTVPLV